MKNPNLQELHAIDDISRIENFTTYRWKYKTILVISILIGILTS